VPASLRVRPARASDLEALVAFNRAMAHETERKRLDAATVRRGVRRALRDAGRGRYFVAERGGRIAGALLLTREWSDWRDGWFWWIQSVYVEPSERRRGVYTSLHRAILSRARSSRDVVGIRLYVEQHNRRAQRVYAALGMRPAGYLVFEQGS
jgi:RimJ/RimL family protein N-acetyltransferase